MAVLGSVFAVGSSCSFGHFEVDRNQNPSRRKDMDISECFFQEIASFWKSLGGTGIQYPFEGQAQTVIQGRPMRVALALSSHAPSKQKSHHQP